MASMESICRSLSTLSEVQIHILKNSETLLQFASDLSHRELILFVPGKEKGTLVVAAARQPLVQQNGDDLQFAYPIGSIQPSCEVPVSCHVLETGEAMQGTREVEYGRMEPLFVYPFADNGGTIIAVMAFIGNVEGDRDILTETAFMALSVPSAQDAGQLYSRLNIQDGVTLVNCNGVVIYADEMAESLMAIQGYKDLTMGMNIYSFQTDMTGAKKAIDSHQGFAEEVTVGPMVFNRRVIPLSRGGKVRRVISIMTEKTELRKKEEELMIKTSVIKEIHHRVKNNLQTIASLLRMQLRRVQTEEAKTALTESLNRIVSISLVHETLSHHDEEIINVSDVAEKLLTLILQSSTSADSHIRTRFSGEELMLPSDEATSLSLVLNELITNAISHGFAGRDKGFLQLDLSCANDQAVVVVADDGCGMKKSQEHMEKRRHLGLQIVQTLVEKDLGGTITYEAAQPEGTVVTIKFPLRKRGE